MVDRSVEVRLRLDISNFQAQSAAASASMALLAANAERLDDRLNRVSTSSQTTARRLRAQDRATQGLDTRLTNLNATLGQHQTMLGQSAGSNAFVRNTNQQSSSINQLTGRIGLLADLAIPTLSALTPIAATGAVGLAGLANAGAGLATVALTSVVAFQGVGDALKAIEAYELDPTAASLEKMQQAMSELAPQAQAFVVAWQDFQPTLDKLQESAAAGMFPGLTEALPQLEKVAPLFERILRRSGMTGGDIIADAADSLDSKRWKPFLRFLAEEMPAAARSSSLIFGDLAHGASEMWMSLDPGNDRFLGWLEDVAAGFDGWASSAEGAEDIERILAYARQNGPAVADMFSAAAGAVSALVEAGAPLGGPLLTGLTSLLNVVEAIADSDMGTPIMAGVLAWRAYARMAPLVAAAQARMMPSVGVAVGRPTTATAAQTAAMAGLSPALQAALLAQRSRDVAAQRRMMMMRGGAMAAGAGLLASGAASDLGVTNTAMLTLAGTMAGPVGAALGAVAGLSLDAAAGNDALADSIEAANAALAAGDIAGGLTALAEAQKQQAEFNSRVVDNSGGGGDLGGQLAAAKNRIEGFFGKSDVEEGEEALADLEARAMSTQKAAAGLGEALGMTIGPLDGSARSTRELEAALAAAQPVMDKLGITTEQLNAAQARKDGTGPDGALGWGLDRAEAAGAIETYDQMIERIRKGQLHAESAAGKTENLAASFAALAEDALPAAEKSQRLSEALDAMIDPAMSAEAATDAWHVSLQNLRQELNNDAGFAGYRKGAVENRALTRSYVDGVKQRLVAMVQAGAGEEEMMGAVRASRREFIESGEAAGISGQKIRRRADAMGLTPDLVRTVFEAVGLVETTIKAERIKTLYTSLPEAVQTRIAVSGVPKTIADAKRIADDLDVAAEDRRALFEIAGAPKTRADARKIANDLDMTAVDRQILMSLIDQASGPARGTGRNLDDAAKNRQATVGLNDQASGKARSIQALLDSMRGRTLVVTTVHRDTRVAAPQGVSANPTHSADGSTVPKTGLPYADRHAYMLADGEEVTSNRFGQADRYRPVLKAINANLPPVEIKAMLAAGGTAGLVGPLGRQSSGGMSWGPIGVTLDTLAVTLDTLVGSAGGAAGGLKGLRKELAAAEKALSKEQQKRQDMLSYRDQVGGSLAGDLFGNGLDGFDTANEANGNDAEAMAAALRKLRKKGLDGPLYDLIASSGDLTTAQQLANESAAGIDQRERAYASTERAERDLGTIAMVEKFDTTLAKQERTIDRLEASTKDLTRELRKLEKAVERGAKNGTREGRRDGAMSLSARTRAGR